MDKDVAFKFEFECFLNATNIISFISFVLRCRLWFPFFFAQLVFALPACMCVWSALDTLYNVNLKTWTNKSIMMAGYL